MKRKLTDDNVEAATGDRKRQQLFIWDTNTAGLGIRVTKKGKKSWVFRYSIDGRDRRLTIDAYPSMDLTAARQRAAELQELVQRREDPAEHSLLSIGMPTLGGLWEQFEEKHLPRRSPGHQRNLRDAFERLILPHFGKNKPLVELTWSEVSDWHQGLGESTPVQANLALAALRVSLNLAKKWGLLERGAFNPATDHEAHPSRRAGRPFSDAELKRIGKALKKESDPIIRVALTVCLLSGLRPGEICGMRWSDLQDGGIMVLEEAKTGQRCAVLPTRAEELMRALPRVGEYAFPGRKSDQPLGGRGQSHGLGNSWKRVRERASLGPGRRLYDARHTWISTAGGLGIGDDIRRVLAGHSAASGSAHGSYLHASPLYREAADRVAEKLAKGLGL